MNLFGRPKPKKVPNISDSIQSLRIAQETLDKREAHLQKQADLALVDAKKALKAKNKKGATFYLKRKNNYQKQIDQIYGKKINIDIQIMALEDAASNKQMLQAMASGRDALQHHVNDDQIEKVADVMDDINDSLAMSDEFGEALSQPIGNQMDDDDILAELDALGDEIADEDIMNLNAADAQVVRPAATQQQGFSIDDVMALPQAPAPEPQKQTDQQKMDDEFDALQASLMFWSITCIRRWPRLGQCLQNEL